ncbi:MAG: chromosomal replication initiator protein DnaA [Corynebacterium sp.]|uniref:chromosomal replication initiator protein DnaA n=1 Tax=Corynebacterium sp. TaxID=1720 RepID=UPI0026DB0B3F|nr:chromosomal replication initiator protein DnaA [Corynebacterium sp.]MDO4762672.1 chromosomal replication initiator protein DnaA [Corynebacterium sp.]
MAASNSTHTSLVGTWSAVVDEISQIRAESHNGAPPFTSQQRAYLKVVRPIALVEGVAVLAVPHQRAKDFIESELSTAICQALGARMGRAFSLAVTVDPEGSLQPAEQPAPPAQQTAPVARVTEHVAEPSHPVKPVIPAPEPVQTVLEPVPATPAPASALEYFTHQHTAEYQPQPAASSHPGFAAQQNTPNPPETAASLHHLAQSPAFTTPRVEPTGWETSHADQHPPAVVTPVEQSPALRAREVPAHNPNRETSLNKRYTFDTYVVSDSNKLPASAAIAVAEKPARAYNPLFVWGDSGLGKTHLMHAIGNYAQQLHPSLRIKYVSSEEFTNDYINSVRDDRQESFKRRYRNLDILMVDDIQFLQGKEGTQEEFFHTFNALQQNGKQVVLSSDRPPNQLTTLEDRLRTRFQAGLIADIYPPDLETRIAILSKKSQADNIVVSRDVLELIASQFNSSIRELEGAFIRVSAFASLNHKPIDLATAEEALRDIAPDQQSVEITAPTIQAVTAEFFNISVEQLISTTKSRPIAHARQLAMYLCRELTELSLPKIGEYFGGKDHTTVMYAERKIRKEITEKRVTYDEIQKLTTMIKNYGRN